MSPSKQTFTFPISSDLKRLLQEVKRREGIPEAEQIRRGLRLWFESKGYAFDEDGRPKAEHNRVSEGTAGETAAPRKRSVKKNPRS